MEYENNSRSKVRAILYSCLKVFIRGSIDGYDRRFFKTHYPDNFCWKMSNSEEIQIDIVAHVESTCELPLTPLKDHGNRLWTVIILQDSKKTTDRTRRRRKKNTKIEVVESAKVEVVATEKLMTTKTLVSTMETTTEAAVLKGSTANRRKRNKRKNKNKVETAGSTDKTISGEKESIPIEEVDMKILVRDSPEKEIEASVHLDSSTVTPMSEFKYIIGEVTTGTNKSLQGKISQLEKDCVFIISKATGIKDTFPSKHIVSKVIAFLILIAPLENPGFVVSAIRHNKETCPIVYQLFCERKFVYIINKETIVEVVKQIKSDVTEFKTSILELGEVIAENKEETSKLRRRLDGIEEKMNSFEEKINEFRNETSKRFDDLMELMKSKV